MDIKFGPLTGPIETVHVTCGNCGSKFVILNGAPVRWPMKAPDVHKTVVTCEKCPKLEWRPGMLYPEDSIGS
jgi:hypothetical protein